MISDFEFFQNEILGELDWGDENLEAGDDPAVWARAEIKRMMWLEKSLASAHKDFVEYWRDCIQNEENSFDKKAIARNAFEAGFKSAQQCMHADAGTGTAFEAKPGDWIKLGRLWYWVCDCPNGQRDDVDVCTVCDACQPVKPDYPEPAPRG